MIKKFILILTFYILVTSCGKKGDPKYIEPKKETKIEASVIKRV